MTLYVTRDKDKALVLCNRKMKKGKTRWDMNSTQARFGQLIDLPDSWFKDVKWSDEEPTIVRLSDLDFNFQQ